MKRPILFLVLLSFITGYSQSAGKIYQDLEKLNFLGSVLYVAAHPDDENTALLSHFANHVHAEAAYLSLTRGDGGQNLIGTELREQLGVIRTNELLEARKIDGGKQFFSSAIDFGYSKNPDETLRIWDKDQILGEVVARIRAYQPDIIIHRFDHRTPGTTHGHHTSSALLSYEAFSLSNDPSRYPEQLQHQELWQVKRQFYNTSWWRYGSRERFAQVDKSNFIALEIGNYNPLTGKSNNELAAESRSSHKSQGFGSAPQLGSRTEYIELIQGDLPKSNDPFEGIDTSWSRLKGGDKVKSLVQQTLVSFDFKRPSKSIPKLLEIYQAIEKLEPSVWKKRKLQETLNLIKACAGLTLQLNASRPYGTAGEFLDVTLAAVQQTPIALEIEKVGAAVLNSPLKATKKVTQNIGVQLSETLTTPYWLKQKGSLGSFAIQDEKYRGLAETPPLSLNINLRIDGTRIEFKEPIQYRTTDPVRGEISTPFYVLPPIAVNFQKNVQLYPKLEEQTVQMEIINYGEQFTGEVELCFPEGWSIESAKKKVAIAQRGGSQFLNYKLKPSAKAKSGLMGPLVHIGEKTLDRLYTVQEIEYEHIPKQYVAQPSEAKLVRLNLEVPQKKVGYIMGAGDLVAEKLSAIGLPIESIDINTATQEELNQFDTLLLGIRAYNVLESLKYKNQMLFDFAQQGGTLIVQYTTSRRMKTKNILPYPIQLSRDRVTDEESPVRILNKEHPVWTTPHKIGKQDFEGWVQERGLYFASSWDPNYTPLIAMKDPNEKETKGSLLVAKHGKGTVVYTGLSFFRELPAGVPGAYRLLLNLIAL